MPPSAARRHFRPWIANLNVCDVPYLPLNSFPLQIQLIELAIYRRQHLQEYSSPLSRAFVSTPYSSTVGPFSCRPSRERSCGRPCEGGYKQSCGSGKPHGPYID
ncbi:hypothetical protein TNCV_2011691 [Trichonephila clavipes]|nr:hypothetical protein TNCV_2011691 [Trichonephila clavipes]